MTTISILDAQQMSAQATPPNAACEAGFAHALEAAAHTDSPHPPPSESPPESQATRAEGASPQAQKTPGTELDPLTETQENDPPSVDSEIGAELLIVPGCDALALVLLSQQVTHVAVTQVSPTAFAAHPAAPEPMTAGVVQALSESTIPTHARAVVAEQALIEGQSIEAIVAPQAPASDIPPSISEPDEPRLAVDAKRVATGTSMIAPAVLDELQPVLVTVQQAHHRISQPLQSDLTGQAPIEAAAEPILPVSAPDLAPETRSNAPQLNPKAHQAPANEPAPTSTAPTARWAEAGTDPDAKPAQSLASVTSQQNLPIQPDQCSKQPGNDVSAQGSNENEHGGVATADPADPATGLTFAQPQQPLCQRKPGKPVQPNAPLTPNGQPRPAVSAGSEPGSATVNATEIEQGTQLHVDFEDAEPRATQPIVSARIIHEVPRDLTAPQPATQPAIDAAQSKSVIDSRRLESAISQIESHLDAIAARSPNKVVIHLQPHDLGTVVLSIEAREGKIDASVAASNPEVRAALEQSRHQIAASLERRGVSVGEVTISEQSAFLGDRSGTRHEQRNPEPDETARMVRMRGLDPQPVRHAVTEVMQRSSVVTFGRGREVNFLI